MRRIAIGALLAMGILTGIAMYPKHGRNPVAVYFQGHVKSEGETVARFAASNWSGNLVMFETEIFGAGSTQTFGSCLKPGDGTTFEATGITNTENWRYELVSEIGVPKPAWQQRAFRFLHLPVQPYDSYHFTNIFESPVCGTDKAGTFTIP